MTNILRFLLFSSLVANTALATTPANCSADFTKCSIPENLMLQFPPGFSAIAGDVIIQDPTGTTVSDIFRIFNNLVDTGGGTGLGTLAIMYSRDNTMPLPDPSTYSANAVFIKETLPSTTCAGTCYFGNGTNYVLDTSELMAATQLVYTGDLTADYHDPANLKAVFTVLATGAPIPGATVTFTVGFQSCTAVTNASGVANCSVVLNHAAGNITVSASTTGIFGLFIGNSTSQPFVVTLEQTTLSYTGDTVIANGGTAHMSGVLLEDNVTPIVGRTVIFTLGTGASAQKCNGITNGTGKAACTISPVAQPLGPVSVGDSFAGDAFYLPASASTGAMLFAFLSQGSFILGDQSAQPGAHATFWGAQWASSNALSGGPAPANFKGFADSLSTEPPNCGVTWTSQPANSSDPPASVPTYMGVLVSPSVAPSGAMLLGGAIQIVVVRTDSGYSGDPGHPGTGTIIAQFCH